MKRKFVSNLAFLVFINLLVKPFWIFGIDRTVQNVVGAESYGLYFALFNFSVLFNIILDFGINNYNNRSVAQDRGFLQSNLSSILFLKIALTVLYLVITFFGAVFLGFNSFQIHLLLILSLNQALLSFVLYLRTNISGMQMFRTDSILSALDKLLMIVICATLLWGELTSFSIEKFIYAQTASLIITAVIALGIVLYHVGKISVSWNFRKVKEIIKSAYPYALLGLLMSVYFRIDGVMIERMLPDEGAFEAGVYAASYRLLDAANMLGFLFATLLLPMFARMLHEKQDINDLLGLSFKTLFSFAAFLAVICFFYREPIIRLLYHDADGYWWRIFGMLIFAFPGICVVYIYGTLLTANGSLRWLNLIAIGGVILNVILNLILINNYKAMGATVATIITQTLVAVAHVIVAKNVFSLKMNYRAILLFSAFLAGMGLINLMTTNLPVDWKTGFALSTAGCVMLAFALRLFDWKKIFALLKFPRD